jgi:tape measure domain-containing protein
MDTHGMKFVVDTTGVAKGFRDYKSAVDGIFASLTKFEAHVDKTMKGVAKASSNPQALNAFKKAVSAFAKVDIDTSAARKLSALSAAMQGFKAPSASQTANTTKFFKALSNGMPDLTNAYRSIKAMNDIKAAMAGFKAPPASASKNLLAFGQAMAAAAPGFSKLKSIAGISGIANELASISIAMSRLKAPTASQVSNIGNLAVALRSFRMGNLGNGQVLFNALDAISKFKAPSAAQSKNLQAFVTALGNLKVPANADALAAALTKIANAATGASGALSRLRGQVGPLGGQLGNLGGQARGASLQMMGLQNAFSGTFQVGSVLRSLLGSLTIAELGRSYFEATNGALAFQAQMSVISKEAGFANAQLTYVNETANKFGIDSLAAAQGFAKVSIAAHKSGLSVMDTRHVFEGFSTSMAVLGTTTAGQQDVWLALQQVMNKGYLSAEELNQQLNEKLPGAMAYATEYANSLGLSLEKGLKTKALDAAGVLAHISKRMKEDFGPAVEEALKRPQNQMTILRNNFRTLFQAIGEAGGNEAFASLLSNINDKMTPEAIQRYAQALAVGLKRAVDSVSAAFNWLYENWDSIKGPLATTLSLIGKFMIVSSALQIGNFIVAPMIAAGRAALFAAPLIMQLVYASRALAATNLAAYYAQLALITNPRVVAGVQALSVAMGRLGATRIGAAALSGLARVPGLARAATVATTGLAAAIGVGLSAAWGIATQAAEDSTGKTIQINYTAGEIISGIWQTMTEWISEKWDIAMTYVDAAAKWLGDQLAFKVEGIGSMFAKLGFGIYYALTKALEGVMRAAIGFAAGMYRTISSIGGALSDLLDGNFSGAAAKAKGAVLGEDMMAGFKGAFGGMQLGGADFEAQYAKVGRGAGVVADWMNSMGAKGRGPAAPAKPTRAEMDAAQIAAMLGQPQATVPEEGKGGGSGGKKGGAAGDFERDAKRVEGAVDSLMQKLLENDPIKELNQEYIETLTKQAHTLLNADGYKQFITTLKSESQQGKLSVESLISAMSDPKNLDSKAIEDLAARYDVSVSQIISLAREQQTAFEEMKKEAVIKQLDKDFRGLAKGMELVGDSVPEIAEMKANIDDLTGLARLIMPADEGFAKFLTDVRTGAISAADALAKLRAIMADPAQMSAEARQFLANSPTSGDEIADATARKLEASKDATREAKLDLEFGGRLLSQRSNEIKLLQMSSQEAEVYTTVMEEVNRVRAKGVIVSQEQINGLMGEVRAQQQLANQMQRNKEFFENNGVRGYINDIKSVGESINELDKNVLQSLEDQLFSLGTTGKFSFQAIFDTLQQGLIRFASQNILKEGLGKLFGGELEGGTPSLLGGLFKAFGIEHAAGTTNPLGSSFTNPMHVVIDPTTGNLLSGLGTVKVGEGTPEELVGAATDTLTNGLREAGNLLKLDLSQAGKGLAGALSQFMSGMAGGGGGGGGLLGGLLNLGMGLLGGGAGGITGSVVSSLSGSAAATIAANPGIFKEGGFPGSPVARTSVHPSAFTNAPHYAEGTPNTSGGHPAILHDNEAVIPLSRGRKVAVEMNGGSRGQTINNNFMISSPDANSFRKSETQIATKMHMQAGRAFRRNHG